MKYDMHAGTIEALGGEIDVSYDGGSLTLSPLSKEDADRLIRALENDNWGAIRALGKKEEE